jgi:hypothetical protein
MARNEFPPRTPTYKTDPATGEILTNNDRPYHYGGKHHHDALAQRAVRTLAESARNGNSHSQATLERLAAGELGGRAWKEHIARGQGPYVTALAAEQLNLVDRNTYGDGSVTTGVADERLAAQTAAAANREASGASLMDELFAGLAAARAAGELGGTVDENRIPQVMMDEVHVNGGGVTNAGPVETPLSAAAYDNKAAGHTVGGLTNGGGYGGSGEPTAPMNVPAHSASGVPGEGPTRELRLGEVPTTVIPAHVLNQVRYGGGQGPQ